jgi:2'-5' RNA ligase
MSTTRADKPRNHRLFLALWPDDAVRGNVQAHAEGWVIPAGSVRYTPQDWHVTLHFLGSIPTDRVVTIAAGIDVPIEPFELVLDQPRLWPRGLAVVGASRTPPALKSLHERLADALRGLQLTVETRPYRPHLTLARRADQAVLPKSPLPIVLPARAFVLVVSTGRTAHRYEILREYRGSGPSDPSGDPTSS